MNYKIKPITKESRDDVKKSPGRHKSGWESSERTIWTNWLDKELLF